MDIIDRQITHGSWSKFCDRSQELKRLVTRTQQTDQVKEGLEMICHKLARIATGDPEFIDHYDDIAGYATRVAEHLRKCDQNGHPGKPSKQTTVATKSYNPDSEKYGGKF